MKGASGALRAGVTGAGFARRSRAAGVVAIVAVLLASSASIATSAEARGADVHRARSTAAARGAAAHAPRNKTTEAARAAPAPTDYQRRPEVIDYVDQLVAQQHFERADLLRVFADARYSATAVRLMTPVASSGVRRDWSAYRARFVEPVRLAAGYRFWDDNAATLERAEREFGVPAEIVVGILGVETVYGRNTGGFRVLDALTTLAFDFPQGRGRGDDARQRDRSAYFRAQLTDALLMTRDSGVDLETLRGSYAGAIGMPQFMPGSIRSYAVDYDGDGRVDLVGSPADVIGSVANYLAQHGWVRDRPTYLPLSGSAGIDAAQQAGIDAMVEAGSVPTLTYASLAAAGLSTSAAVVEPLALIDLPSGSDAAGRPLVTYLAGTQNFHAITRYNRSYFYAFSVIELGSTIKALRDVRP